MIVSANRNFTVIQPKHVSLLEIYVSEKCAFVNINVCPEL